MNDPHAVILGAGPYGLSLAAHFREAGISFRIFGKPMRTWKTQMPVGMKLKSDGFASSLSAGSASYTLGEFCRETSRPYHDTLIPVPLEDFVAYGEEFARRFVPNLEECYVTNVERAENGFRITLDTGEVFHAGHVVVATGICLYQHIPDFLAKLPDRLVTHTAEHRTFDEFAGRDVTVLGRGASALNAAVLLSEAGAEVTLIARSRKIHIHEITSENRSLYQKLRHPLSPLGVGIRSWLACTWPSLYRILPPLVRRTIAFKHLGPAGGTALQGRIDGQFPSLLGWSVTSVELLKAEAADSPRLKLILAGPHGERREHITSHVIAGTGYRVDLSRLQFLSAGVRDGIRLEHNGAPKLNRNFETTVEGLYFVGPASVANFGPLQRFAAGAGYAATRVTQRIARDLAPGKNRNPRQVPLPSVPQQ